MRVHLRRIFHHVLCRGIIFDRSDLDFVAGSFDEENIKIAMSVVYRDARKGCNRSEFVYE